MGRLNSILTTIANKLNSKVNTVYTASGTIAAVYGTWQNIASVTLPAGTYLLIGIVGSDISNDTFPLAANVTGLIITRSMNSMGGGTCVSGVVTLTEQTEVTLSSYGYGNTTYNLIGSLYAVKLLSGGVTRRILDRLCGISERGCVA